MAVNQLSFTQGRHVLGKTRLGNRNQSVEILDALAVFGQRLKDHQADRVSYSP